MMVTIEWHPIIGEFVQFTMEAAQPMPWLMNMSSTFYELVLEFVWRETYGNRT